MICQNCGKTFDGPPIRKHCSRKCFRAARMATITCKTCGEKATGPRCLIGKRKYCSRPCFFTAQRGRHKSEQGRANIAAASLKRGARQSIRHKARHSPQRLSVLREYVLELRHANKMDAERRSA